MTNMKTRLIDLLNIHGVSGHEKPVCDYLEPILSVIMDSVVIDDYGNLLGELKVGTGEGATIMLSAHMDTVKDVSKDKVLVELDGIIKAKLPNGERAILGADDRAGIAIIVEVLRNIPHVFNGTIKVAFTREEEIGSIGAEKIQSSFYSDVNLVIVVDRQGNRDIVVGSAIAFCSDAVGIFMEHASKVADMDWVCVEGGMSDAVTFSSRGINTINLSAGYMNEHTNREFVSLFSMKETVKLILKSLELVNSFYLYFGEPTNRNKWLEEDFMMWEEQNDSNGDVYAYTVDEDIILQQGDNEVRMAENNFESLYKKVQKAIAKRL